MFGRISLAVGVTLAIVLSVNADEKRKAGANRAIDDRILFVSNRIGMNRVGIYSMAPDGSQPTRWSDADAILEIDPTYSPDRKQIAFAAQNRNSKEEYATAIFVANADGSGRKQLTDQDEMACAPSWSPDGARLVFCDFNVWLGKRGIFVVDAEGQNRRKLADGIFPAWSPDGKSILFVADDDARGTRLMVLDVDSEKTTPVGEEPALMGNWSPDGKRIIYMSAFQKDNESSSDLFLINRDGSGRTQLTKTPDTEFGPQWSTDGKRIHFARAPGAGEAAFRSGDKSELFSVDVDANKEEQLTNNESYDGLRTGPFVLFFSHPKTGTGGRDL